MILYSDNLIVLDYNPETDVLFVQWPDLRQFSMVEVEYSFKLLIQNIKSYDIKKLLIDSSGSNADVNNKEYQALMLQLAADFNETRLQKIGRVVSRDPVREAQLENNSRKMNIANPGKILYRNFELKEEAMNWLLS